MAAVRVRVGRRAEIEAQGCVAVKAGSRPVCVVWSDGRAWALDDRCPHLGFPLHRGSVDEGILTCHWHHARFDLASGGTFDPWADDVHVWPVEDDGEQLYIVVDEAADPAAEQWTRLEEGLGQGIDLVVAKAVSGLVDSGADPEDIVRAGLGFGLRNRRRGWGAGLTMLVCVANLLRHLDRGDRGAALVHALSMVAADCRGQPANIALRPLNGGSAGAGAGAERLETWYRQAIETRDADAAERIVRTLAALPSAPFAVEAVQFAAATDHPFLDTGHVVDFTDKAYQALRYAGSAGPDAADLAASLVPVTVGAHRHDEDASWLRPVDLPAAIDAAVARVRNADGRGSRAATAGIRGLAERLLAEDAAEAIDALAEAFESGVPPADVARAVSFAAVLRVLRFHPRNEYGDWDTVHHMAR